MASNENDNATTCDLCKFDINDEIVMGPFKRGIKFKVHYFCLVSIFENMYNLHFVTK